MMIGYVTLGTNDIETAKTFYDGLMPTLDARLLMDSTITNRILFYANAEGKPLLAIATTYDGKPASVGNGTMVALSAADRKQVDAIHAKAVALGASDDGAPGLRGEEGPQAFYGAYFRDPDGNKLCAYKFG